MIGRARDTRCVDTRHKPRPEGRDSVQDGGSWGIRIGRQAVIRQGFRRHVPLCFSRKDVDRRHGNGHSGNASATRGALTSRQAILAVRAILTVSLVVCVQGDHCYCHAHRRGMNTIHRRSQGQGQRQHDDQQPTNSVERHRQKILTHELDSQSSILPENEQK